MVRPDDLPNFYHRWDRKLESAFKRFCRVEQPLAAYLSADTLCKSIAIARGQYPMDSILSCYYNADSHPAETLKQPAPGRRSRRSESQ
jgi:hypothetical protein